MSYARDVIVRPAYDAMFDDPPHRPKRDYGRHGAEIHFVLKGSGGAVAFTISTMWMLPETWAHEALTGHEQHVPPDLEDWRVPTGPTRHDGGEFPHLFCRPMPSDVGYHAIRKPARRYLRPRCLSRCCAAAQTRSGETLNTTTTPGSAASVTRCR